MLPQRSDVHELPAPGVAAGEVLELLKVRLLKMSGQSPLAPPGFPCRPSTASAHPESKGTTAVSAPGGEEVVSVNVRPVAATNRDPKEAIAEGRLCPDLHQPREDGAEVRVPLGTSIEEAKRRLILLTLSRESGKKTRGAAALGIRLKALHNRLNLYRSEDSGLVPLEVP